MKYLIPVITAVAAGALVFLLMQQQIRKVSKDAAARQVEWAAAAVKSRFDLTARDLSSRLGDFAGVVASDRDFSLKLFVEADRSAPEVTRMAVQFLAPMGLSLLEITDSAQQILSSGHFPASAGNSVRDKALSLTGDPAVITDNIMGTDLPTLQARSEFRIADQPFYAIGGLVLDQKFLKELSPCKGVEVLLKRGGDYIGMEEMRSVSELKDGRIIINDKEYPAAAIDLPTAESEGPAVLIVVAVD